MILKTISELIIAIESGDNMGIIYFTEKNIHGAWVIYGMLGVRQYYFYTKKRAMEKYKEEYRMTFVKNKNK